MLEEAESWRPLVRGFLPGQVDECGAGGPDLDGEQRRLGELRAADLVHADHDQIGIELSLRAKRDGRLGHDTKVFGASVGQHTEQAQASAIVTTLMVPPSSDGVRLPRSL
jgi:hypothetical protein